MREEIAKAAQKFINLEVIALAFLLPLFFLPVTTEFFEFNKLALLALAVVLGVVAWGIKVVASGKLDIRHSAFDIPIIFFWLVTLVSTVFSEHLMTSLAGHYLRWHPSLVTVTLFTVFYFLLASNLERWALKYIGYALVASSTVAGLLFIPQYFGANLFGQEWSAGRAFTPLGSLNTFALFLGVTAPLALRMMLPTSPVRSTQGDPEHQPNGSAGRKLAGLTLTLLLLLVLTMLNSPVGWIALAASLMISLGGLGREGRLGKGNWPYLLVTLVAFVAFVALILVPPIRNATPFRDGPPREIGLDLRTSWSVSATSFRQRPLWGSGPGTFLFDFTRYKPLSYNYTPLWSIRFDKPISEYLLAFAEMGLLGVLAYLFLLAVFIRTIFQLPITNLPVRQAGYQLLPLGAGALAAFFLTCSTATSMLLLLLALASISSTSEESRSTSLRATSEVTPFSGGSSDGGAGGYVLLALSIAFAFFLGLGVYRTSAAELAHRQSIQAFRSAQTETTSDRMIAELQRAYNQQLRTLAHFPWRDQYHANLAQISFIWANQLAGKPDLTDEDRGNIQFLVSQAIAEAKRATDLSPLNVNNWEMLAQTYRNLIGFAQGAEDWAANSYLQAINLDLFNPVLRVNFGGLFYQQQDFERAIEQFRAAVNLKNNFANARYNLGMAYKETGKTDLAIQEIETALRLTPEDTPGYEEAKAVLEELKQQQ